VNRKGSLKAEWTKGDCGREEADELEKGEKVTFTHPEFSLTKSLVVEGPRILQSSEERRLGHWKSGMTN